MNDPVVVTGADAVSSLGGSLDQTWAGLLAGARGLRLIQRFDASAFPVRVAAEMVTPSSADPDRQRRIDNLPTSVLLAASRAALAEAGLEAAATRPEDVAFFAAIGALDYDVEDLLPAVVAATRGADGGLDYRAFFREHHRKIHPLWLLTQLNNIAACQVAIALDIQGGNTVLSQHADAGAQAIAEGFHAVREGRAAVALVAGASEEITPISLARYLLAGVLSTAAGGECRPFHRARTGTLLGEGGGALVLERASSATARGARARAVVAGVGSACEASDYPGPPTSAAIVKAMEAALSEAGLGPEAIDLVIANGDGTPAGDAREMSAIERVCGRSLESLAVVSVKGAVGHLLAGAPLLDAALAVRILREGIVPGLAADLVPDPGSALRLVIGGPIRRPVNRILVNAHGFAGQCATLVLARAGDAG